MINCIRFNTRCVILQRKRKWEREDAHSRALRRSNHQMFNFFHRGFSLFYCFSSFTIFNSIYLSTFSCTHWHSRNLCDIRYKFYSVFIFAFLFFKNLNKTNWKEDLQAGEQTKCKSDTTVFPPSRSIPKWMKMPTKRGANDFAHFLRFSMARALLCAYNLIQKYFKTFCKWIGSRMA